MRRWGFSVAATILSFVSLALPFLYLHEADTYSPLGFQTQVWVRDARPSATVDGLSEMVNHFAQAHHVNIARQQAASDNAFFGRELYIAVGAKNQGAAKWISDGYPNFSRLAQTDVHVWADLDFEQIDPRGYYLLDAPRNAGTELAEAFSERGYTASAFPYGGSLQHLQGTIGGQNGTSALIAVLAAIVLVGATVLLDAKSYGVGRLHGRSSKWLLQRDIIAAAPIVLLIWSSLTALVIVTLAWYNGLHQTGTYWLLVAALLTASGAAAVITHVAAILLTSRVDVIAAIKGQLPTRTTLAAAYLVRVPAALLAVASISTAVALAAPRVQATEALDAAHEHAGDAAYILLNGSLGESDTADLLNGDVARWFERADLEKRIILSHDTSASYWNASRLAVDTAPRLSAPTVLTVNHSYLSEQMVLSESGAAIIPDDLPTDRATVLVPASRLPQAETIVAQAVEDLDFARSRSGAAGLPPPAQRTIQSGQSLFTYGNALGPSRAVVEDASLVVVPPQLKAWGLNYIDMAESIVLREPGLPEDIRADPRLSTAVLATLPVQQKIADDARAAELRWMTAVVTAVVASVVLLAVVASAVAVYVRAWSARLFVRFVHGWSRLAANPVLLAAEVGVFAVASYPGLKPWLSEKLAAPPSSSIPPPRNLDVAVSSGVLLSITVGTLLVSALVTAGVLRARERRIVNGRAIDRM